MLEPLIPCGGSPESIARCCEASAGRNLLRSIRRIRGGQSSARCVSNRYCFFTVACDATALTNCGAIFCAFVRVPKARGKSGRCERRGIRQGVPKIDMVVRRRPPSVPCFDLGNVHGVPEGPSHHRPGAHLRRWADGRRRPADGSGVRVGAQPLAGYIRSVVAGAIALLVSLLLPAPSGTGG